MTTGRFDIYRGIHKAFRLLMTETLLTVGRADHEDRATVEAALGQVRRLMHFCRLHVEDENAFVHAAIEARRPGGAAETAADHAHHLEDIAGIEALADTVDRCGGADRAVALHRLYRQLAVFTAENFLHMEVEESRNNAALWALYTDEELMEIDARIIASLPPEAALEGIHFILLAASPAERAGILAHMRAGAPEPVFDRVLETLRPKLSPLDRQKLALALDRKAAA